MRVRVVVIVSCLAVVLGLASATRAQAQPAAGRPAAGAAAQAAPADDSVRTLV
jgi:hypothetical protein